VGWNFIQIVVNMDKTIVAIASLTVLEGLALYFHIDGQLFATVIALIAGLGGYHLGKNKKDDEDAKE